MNHEIGYEQLGSRTFALCGSGELARRGLCLNQVAGADAAFKQLPTHVLARLTRTMLSNAGESNFVSVVPFRKDFKVCLDSSDAFDFEVPVHRALHTIECRPFEWQA